MTTRDEFWTIADHSRLEAEYLADEKLQYLQHAPLEALQQICIQYRHFTKEFPDNLAILISKAPYGKFKSLTAEILAEELGEGDHENNHLQLWDNYLLSIGINQDLFEDSLSEENKSLLDEIKQLTLNKPTTYVIGLCGMGGECLCQVYLSTMYKYLIKNPYIKENKHTIDWDFWNFHVGEADIIHRQKVRDAINEIVDADPSTVDDLTAGYQKAKHNWDTFWKNNYKLAMTKQMAAVN